MILIPAKRPKSLIASLSKKQRQKNAELVVNAVKMDAVDMSFKTASGVPCDLKCVKICSEILMAIPNKMEPIPNAIADTDPFNKNKIANETIAP